MKWFNQVNIRGKGIPFDFIGSCHQVLQICPRLFPMKDLLFYGLRLEFYVGIRSLVNVVKSKV